MIRRASYFILLPPLLLCTSCGCIPLFDSFPYKFYIQNQTANDLVVQFINEDGLVETNIPKWSAGKLKLSSWLANDEISLARRIVFHPEATIRWKPPGSADWKEYRDDPDAPLRQFRELAPYDRCGQQVNFLILDEPSGYLYHPRKIRKLTFLVFSAEELRELDYP